MSNNSADYDFLAGVRVVDFTQFEAGPTCTEALAWLGAEVVKIENPRTGDPGRRLRPGQPDDDPYYFQQFNANKKSITLNLKEPQGLALVKDLLRKADITVENMAPGTIERLGVNLRAHRANAVAARKSRAICGQIGPVNLRPDRATGFAAR